jgi:hypothetical protein
MNVVEELLALPLAELKARLLAENDVVPNGLLEALGERLTAWRARISRADSRAAAGQSSRRATPAPACSSTNKNSGKRAARWWPVWTKWCWPLAGPVMAGAVILPQAYKLRELNDSKKLDEATRERLAEQIKAEAIAWAMASRRLKRLTS